MGRRKDYPFHIPDLKFGSNLLVNVMIILFFLLINIIILIFYALYHGIHWLYYHSKASNSQTNKHEVVEQDNSEKYKVSRKSKDNATLENPRHHCHTPIPYTIATCISRFESTPYISSEDIGQQPPHPDFENILKHGIILINSCQLVFPCLDVDKENIRGLFKSLYFDISNTKIVADERNPCVLFHNETLSLCFFAKGISLHTQEKIYLYSYDQVKFTYRHIIMRENLLGFNYEGCEVIKFTADNINYRIPIVNYANIHLEINNIELDILSNDKNTCAAFVAALNNR